MIESMTNEMMEQARTAAHEEVSAMNPYDAKLTAEAREFFQRHRKNCSCRSRKLFPQETIDRIFDDMVKSRPLLNTLDCAMLASASNSSNQLKLVKLFGARLMGKSKVN